MEHCQLLIREAMLMRFIDSLIRRTERPPAVAVCVLPPPPPSPVLLFFPSASSSLLASSSQRGSCFHWTETAGGLLVFPPRSVMNTAEKLHLYHHSSSPLGCLLLLRGWKRAERPAKTHTHTQTPEPVGIWVRVALRERQAAGPH